MSQDVYDIEQLKAVDPFATGETSTEGMAVFPELKTEVTGEPVDDEPVESKKEDGRPKQTPPTPRTLFGPETFQEIFDRVDQQHQEPNVHVVEGVSSSEEHVESVNGDVEEVVDANATLALNDSEDSDTVWKLRLERLVERRNGGFTTQTFPTIPHTALEEIIEQEIDPEEDENLVHVEWEPEANSSIDDVLDIYDRLSELGGISKTDVIQMESFGVQICDNPQQINRFSATPSLTGYTASMETIGSRIREMIRELIAKIIEKIKSIAKWIVEKSTALNTVIEQDPKKLLDIRKTIIDTARKIDATSGPNTFKELASSDDPAVAMSSSTENYAINYLNVQTRMRFSQRYTQGMKLIFDGTGLASHIEMLGRECINQANHAAKLTDLLSKSELTSWGSVDTTLQDVELKRLAQFWKVNTTESTVDILTNYRSAVQQAFRQPAGGKPPTDFLRAASYVNPFTRYETINREVLLILKNVGDQLHRLQKKTDGLDANQSYQVATGKLNEVSRRLTMTQNLLSMYKVFHTHYNSYYQRLAQPAVILRRRLEGYASAHLLVGNILNR